MLKISPFTASHETAVRNFNRRLEPSGMGPFPERSEPDWLPNVDGLNLFQEYFLAVDDESEVHGAYILKHQDFLIDEEIQSIADYRFPLSEGIVDQAYNFLGLRLLTDALKRQPRLFALGMGGFDQPLPMMLKAARWSLAEVPFYFLPVHPAAVTRNLAPLRRTLARRIVGDLAAFSGLGWVGVKCFQAVRPGLKVPREIGYERVAEFTSWADDLWRACKDEYALLAVRDMAVLKALYPAADPRFIRVKVIRDEKAIGWAILLATQMEDDRHFGHLKLGTLVDCLADPADAPLVVASARDVLEAEGVDLIVSNQSHTAWCEALAASGFIRGPSNFVFAASPKLAAPFQPFEQYRGAFHINRGDGDGPIHL